MRNAISLQIASRQWASRSFSSKLADQTTAVSPVQTYVRTYWTAHARNSYQRRDPAAVRHRRDTQARLYLANGVHWIDSHQRFSCPPRSRRKEENSPRLVSFRHERSPVAPPCRAVVVSHGTDKVGAERTDEPLSLFVAAVACVIGLGCRDREDERQPASLGN
jgi:hypothetical protein